MTARRVAFLAGAIALLSWTAALELSLGTVGSGPTRPRARRTVPAAGAPPSVPRPRLGTAPGPSPWPGRRPTAKRRLPPPGARPARRAPSDAGDPAAAGPFPSADPAVRRAVVRWCMAYEAWTIDRGDAETRTLASLSTPALYAALAAAPPLPPRRRPRVPVVARVQLFRAPDGYTAIADLGAGLVVALALREGPGGPRVSAMSL